jgi:cyclophilin family peptidyl-prolyl cis-trans isomerase
MGVRHIIAIFLFFLVGVLFGKKDPNTYVEITTTKGTIVVKLFDETPLHKENFITLANDGFFDSIYFHRVIDGFMIQTGDPNTKPGGDKKDIGNGGPGYKLPAEFVPTLFHKKGVLAAARLGDQMNPEKQSSGSQFYIVQGKKLSDSELDNMESLRNRRLKTNGMQKLLEGNLRDEAQKLVQQLQKAGSISEQEQLKIVEKLDSMLVASGNYTPFAYSEEQREVYKNEGGTPHLDGEYTIFGEVVEGNEVVDEIAAAEVSGSTPKEPIYMTVKVLKKYKPKRD